MRKSVICLMIFMVGMTTISHAQTTVDTLKTEIRSYVARNFSEVRTFNLYWETSPSHDYTLKQNGSKFEKGKMRNEHTVKFAATVPIYQKNRFSFYANANANFYLFETENELDGSASSMFKDNEESYSYFKAGVNGTYFLNVFNKPLMLSAAISGDGWYHGFEKMEATLTAILMLKRTASTNISVGLHGTTLFDLVPAVPIVVFIHQFNPNLSVDITLPSRTYLRYQFKNNHRVSIGSSLDREHFYYKPNIENIPETTLYSKSNIKTEFVYEYIINKHFYLIARGGGSQPIMSGLFKTNRKGDGDGKPLLEYSQPMTPFFYLGFSYNLFK